MSYSRFQASQEFIDNAHVNTDIYDKMYKESIEKIRLLPGEETCFASIVYACKKEEHTCPSRMNKNNRGKTMSKRYTKTFTQNMNL